MKTQLKFKPPTSTVIILQGAPALSLAMDAALPQLVEGVKADRKCRKLVVTLTDTLNAPVCLEIWTLQVMSPKEALSKECTWTRSWLHYSQGTPIHPHFTSVEETHRIKIWDYLVEEAQTLNATIVDALFCIEVSKVGEGGKHDTNLIIRLTIQLLHIRAWKWGEIKSS